MDVTSRPHRVAQRSGRGRAAERQREKSRHTGREPLRTASRLREAHLRLMPSPLSWRLVTCHLTNISKSGGRRPRWSVGKRIAGSFSPPRCVRLGWARLSGGRDSLG